MLPLARFCRSLSAARRTLVFRSARLLGAGALLAAALLGLAGCDSNGDDVDFAVGLDFIDGGAYEIRGNAYFSTEGDRFRIELDPFEEPSGFREGVVLERTEAGMPGPGRYDFVLPAADALPPGRFAGAFQVSLDGTSPPLYYVERGVLVIESASEERVRGRLVNVQARRVEAGGDGNAPLGVTLEGFFEARPGPVRSFPL